MPNSGAKRLIEIHYLKNGEFRWSFLHIFYMIHSSENVKFWSMLKSNYHLFPSVDIRISMQRPGYVLLCHIPVLFVGTSVWSCRIRKVQFHLIMAMSLYTFHLSPFTHVYNMLCSFYSALYEYSRIIWHRLKLWHSLLYSLIHRHVYLFLSVSSNTLFSNIANRYNSVNVAD
jgi:hypothetical protein